MVVGHTRCRLKRLEQSYDRRAASGHASLLFLNAVNYGRASIVLTLMEGAGDYVLLAPNSSCRRPVRNELVADFKLCNHINCRFVEQLTQQQRE